MQLHTELPQSDESEADDVKSNDSPEPSANQDPAEESEPVKELTRTASFLNLASKTSAQDTPQNVSVKTPKTLRIVNTAEAEAASKVKKQESSLSSTLASTKLQEIFAKGKPSAITEHTSPWASKAAENRAEKVEQLKRKAEQISSGDTPSAPWAAQPQKTTDTSASSDPTPAESSEISDKDASKRQKQEKPDIFTQMFNEDEEWRMTVAELRGDQIQGSLESLISAAPKRIALVGKTATPRPDGTNLPLGAIAALKARSKPRKPLLDIDGFFRGLAKLQQQEQPTRIQAWGDFATQGSSSSTNRFQALAENEAMHDSEEGEVQPDSSTTHKLSWAEEVNEQERLQAEKEQQQETFLKEAAEDTGHLFQALGTRRQSAEAIATQVQQADALKTQKLAIQAQVSGQAATDVEMSGVPSLRGMRHPTTKLSDIDRTIPSEVWLSYRTISDNTESSQHRYVGGMLKLHDADHSFKILVDGGHLGTPSLNLILKASLHPGVPIEKASNMVSGATATYRQDTIITLRFPTGDFKEKTEDDSRYSIYNMEYGVLDADNELSIEANRNWKGSRPQKVIGLSFSSDGNFLDGFPETFEQITMGHSEELRKSLTHLRLIHNMKQPMRFQCAFIYRPKDIDSFLERTMKPLLVAVDHHLPQYFPYRDASTRSAVADVDCDQVAEVGDGMQKDPKTGAIKVTYWPKVKQFDNADHYLLNNSIGRVREHQNTTTATLTYAMGTHTMWVVEPTYFGNDTKWKAFIKLAPIIMADGTSRKLPAPADGTFMRIQQVGKDESHNRIWGGHVKHVKADELNDPNYGTTDFDFMIMCNFPKNCLIPLARFDSYEQMAMNVHNSSQLIKLRSDHGNASVQRGLDALRYLESQGDKTLIDVLLGRHAPDQEDDKFLHPKDAQGNKFSSTVNLLCKEVWKLNDSQIRAIMNAFKYRLSLIQGPPGTGKTWTIACLAWLSVLNGKRALACATSNDAVDEITRKLEASVPDSFYPLLKSYPIVRAHIESLEFKNVRDHWQERAQELLGAKDELAHIEEASGRKDRKRHYKLQQFSIAAAIMDLALKDRHRYTSGPDNIDPADVCWDFRRIMDAYATSQTDGSIVSQEDNTLFVQQYTIMARRVLDNANLVLSTCNNAGSDYLLEGYVPDIILVDEAAQCPEIDMVIPLCRYPSATRWVLCGDHKQLAPICPSVNFNEAAKQVVYSSFERFVDLNYPMTMLNVNYRSTARIMRFLTEEYYENLECYGEADNNPLVDFVRQFNYKFYGKVTEALFVDVPNGVQHMLPGSHSLTNAAEAIVAAQIVVRMLCEPIEVTELPPGANIPASPPKSTDIGVIVLYANQINVVRRFLRDFAGAIFKDYPTEELEKVEISTVDSFQGREKPIIISSFVATTSMRLDGKPMSEFFLDDRRLCVTLSRARYGYIMLGNADAMADARFKLNYLGLPKISKIPAFYKSRDCAAVDESQDETDVGMYALAEQQHNRARHLAQQRAQLQNMAAQAPPSNFSEAGVATQFFQQRGDRGNRGNRGNRGDRGNRGAPGGRGQGQGSGHQGGHGGGPRGSRNGDRGRGGGRGNPRGQGSGRRGRG